jgi:succinate dehydrogenase / fumarate reductase flavoprotein subunit
VRDTIKNALEPFEHPANEGPYKVQMDLQEMMQDKVGIVRVEKEMNEALAGLEKLKARAKKVHVDGNREFNPGWHTALDLKNLLTISEAIAKAAIERKESRGGHFRDDYPNKDAEAAKFNLVIRKNRDGTMNVSRQLIPQIREDLKAIIDEMK